MEREREEGSFASCVERERAKRLKEGSERRAVFGKTGGEIFRKLFASVLSFATTCQ